MADHPIESTASPTEGTVQNPVDNPVAESSEVQTTKSFNDFDEDAQKYLKSQGVGELKDLSDEHFGALSNLAKHGISMRKSVASNSNQQTPDANQALEDVLSSSKPVDKESQQEQTPAVEEAPTAPTQAAGRNPNDDLLQQIFLSDLGRTMPSIAHKLQDGSIFKALVEDGVPLRRPDGSLNAQAIRRRAELESQLITAKGEQTAPAADTTPDANAETFSTSDGVVTMTEDNAFGILKNSSNHTEAEIKAANAFLEKSASGGLNL